MADKVWHDEADIELINTLLKKILKDEKNLNKETRQEIIEMLKGKE